MAVEISDELQQSLRANWARSEGTAEFIKELTTKRDVYLTRAMNLSTSSPLDKDLIHINVSQAKAINDMIAMVTKK